MRKKTCLIAFILSLANPAINAQDNAQHITPSPQKIWTPCEAGMEFSQGKCTGTAKTMSWPLALDYCAKLDGPQLWHLPTRSELMEYYFKAMGHFHYINLYWTSSSDPNRPELAWYLIPVLGWVYTNYKELDGLVLCVADTQK